MHVQVEHHLATVIVAIDDEPETILRDAFAPGDVPRHDEHVTQRGFVRLGHVVHRGDRLVRHDQHVHRRLGTDVAEGGDAVVLVHDGGGNLAGDDLLENGGHGSPASSLEGSEEYAAGRGAVDASAPVASGRISRP
jgi:hypothetical protein